MTMTQVADLVCTGWGDGDGYRLLDSGSGRKLEALGGYVVDRPSVQALWRQRLAATDWQAAQSMCERKSDGGGRWEHRGDSSVLAQLSCRWRGHVAQDLNFELRLTDFGHCGLFIEQEPIWRLAQQRLLGITGRQPRCANLFGYTGAASLAAAQTGAEVFHVDSAKGVLDWGKCHAQRSQQDGVRWIHDDVRSFVALSKKRGWTYDVVLVDPPSFGHGKRKQETWQFEDDVAQLVADCLAITADDGVMVLSCHTPGVQREALVNLVTGSGLVTAGELGVAHADDGRVLPAGIYAQIDRA